MTDFRAASPGAREGTDQNWDEATKCKACECEENVFHIPIESKTSCLLVRKSDKRMAYTHSHQTPACDEKPKVINELDHFFTKIDNKIAMTMRVERKVRKCLNNIHCRDSGKELDNKKHSFKSPLI